MTGLALRILDTGLLDARRNVALSAALMEEVGSGRSPPTLCFARYRPACVIGRFQACAVELDLPGCRREGVAIARRASGGGAVVVGPGILTLDLVLPGRASAMGRVAGIVHEALLDLFRSIGLLPELTRAGSVEIEGRKISGSAGRSASCALMHQVTLIEDLAEAAPVRLLRRRTEGGRPTTDPTHRLAALHEWSGIAAEPHLARFIGAALALPTRPGAATPEEIARASALHDDLYGREDFVLSGTAPQDLEEAA